MIRSNAQDSFMDETTLPDTHRAFERFIVFYS